MTTKKFCDVCGKDIINITENGEQQLIISNYSGVGTDGLQRHYKHYDFCIDCAEKIERMIKEGKIK